MDLKKTVASKIPSNYTPTAKRIFNLLKTFYHSLFYLSPYRYIQKLKFKKMNGIKLNVGCGKAKLKGWINVDIHPSADFMLDLRRKLPFRDNSIAFIYCEHVFEHLTYNEGRRVLKEFYRCLNKNGIVRIAMPDLDYVIQKYNTDWENQDWLTWPGHEHINTKGKMINISFRWWEHKFLYNEEDLQIQYKESGFINMIRCKQKESNYSDLKNLETREDSKLIMEAEK